MGVAGGSGSWAGGGSGVGGRVRVGAGGSTGHCLAKAASAPRSQLVMH